MVVSLRAVSLFAELSDEDLEEIESHSEILTLRAGEQLFAEGDRGDHAYVITDGEIEITKRANDHDVRLAIRTAGEVVGEMALLEDAPRSASGRARTDATLIAIPRSVIDALMESNVGAARALLSVVLERWKSIHVMLRHSERMAQLGTMTAGLAHELNNPAAAVNRSVGQLRESVGRLVALERSLAAETGLDDDTAMTSLRDQLRDQQSDQQPPHSAFDLEDEIARTLTDAGIDDPWRLAPVVIEAGLHHRIAEIIEVASSHTAEFLAVLVSEHEVQSLLHEVEEGTKRLSSIVRALKSYSYLDQGPVQEVDLVTGLEDTLLILKSKLSGIKVERDFAPELEPIQAYGGELNQVWTNLIDNAADSIRESGRPDGIITLRAHPDGDSVVVEVADNGPGISPEAINRVFDSFYTTKPPGSGTGLGLNIVHSVVVGKHGGDIAVESDAGRTVFRVRLPTRVRE